MPVELNYGRAIGGIGVCHAKYLPAMNGSDAVLKLVEGLEMKALVCTAMPIPLMNRGPVRG
jgi:hypothetical protein